MSSTHIITAIDLTYAVVNEDFSTCIDYVTILDRIDSEFRSGELTAVMGASGAGKTHLFDLIIGNVQQSSKTSGCILYDGKERAWEEWIKKVSFLPQDDVYYPELTVHDSVSYYASYNEKLSEKEKKELTTKVLKSCCIYDKRNAVISSLSGGERKRAMIALAMIGQPELLILDEPTSGLDSNNALLIVASLKKYAIEKNAIVIMTVHQPGEGLFNLFDHLYYLTRNGVFYDGTVTGLQEWLTSHNIEKPDKISLCEFVFELHSKESVIPEIRRYDNIVNQIVQDNMRKEKRDDEPTVCNNNRVIVMEAKFFDIIRLLKNSMLLYIRTGYLSKLLLIVFAMLGIQMTFICKYMSTLFDKAQVDSSSIFYKMYINSLSPLDKIDIGFSIFSICLPICCIINLLALLFTRTDNAEIIVKELHTGKYSALSYTIAKYTENFVVVLSMNLILCLFFICYVLQVIKHSIIVTLVLLVAAILYTLVFTVVYMFIESLFPIYDKLSFSAFSVVLLSYASATLWFENDRNEQDNFARKFCVILNIFPSALIHNLQYARMTRLILKSNSSHIPNEIHPSREYILLTGIICYKGIKEGLRDNLTKIVWFTGSLVVDDWILIVMIACTLFMNVYFAVHNHTVQYAPNIRTKLSK